MASDPLNEFVRDALAKSQLLGQRAAEWHARYQRQIDTVMQSLSNPVVSAAAWVQQHEPQIRAVLDQVNAFTRLADQIEQQWADAGLGYLVSPLGMGEHLFLSVYAAPGDADELLDFLEAAMADPAFIERTCQALDAAPVLSDVARQHLEHGLSHLQQHEPINAWPPLIIGLEGAFTDVAIDQGVAVRGGNHVYLADANGKPLPKKSPSVEGVAKLLGHGDDTDFGEFLIRQVYGGEGNPFRHGTARDGVRDRTICLAVAVLGWLDAFVTPGTLDLLREAVVDELERREEDETEESPGE
jgi:hypothetical protein